MVTAIQMIILGNGAMNVSNEFAIDVMFDVETFWHLLVMVMGSVWCKVLCDDLRILHAFKGHKMCIIHQICGELCCPK